MNSDLVYVKHEVEVAAWGPYQPCNINPDRPNDPFTCEGARTQVSVPAHDLEMCEKCPRTYNHAGWYPLSQMAKGWSPPPKALGGACLALANQTCGAVATAGHRGQCETCINTYRKTLFNETGSCAGSALKAEWCPAFVPVTKACEIAANKSCGSAQHRMANRAACTTCVEAHATELYAAGCPTDGKPLYNYSIELCEEAPKRPDPYAANIMLMAKVAGGSWFSTPTQGKCASTTEPFNGAGGKPNCTWKDMGIGKIANFTCINSGLNRAVRAKNMTCFDQCPDGNQVYPVSASDCWLDCFYRIVSGGTNGQFGKPLITQEELVTAWSLGFESTDPEKGGCPSLHPVK